jgi:hypothetical protein
MRIQSRADVGLLQKQVCMPCNLSRGSSFYVAFTGLHIKNLLILKLASCARIYIIVQPWARQQFCVLHMNSAITGAVAGVSQALNEQAKALRSLEEINYEKLRHRLPQVCF